VKMSSERGASTVPHEGIRSKGQRVPLFLLAGLGLTLFAPMTFASPCATATISTYDSESFTCTIDGYTLEDFTFGEFETGGATLLSDSQIILTPTTSPGGMLFTFSPASEPNFEDGAGQTEEYVFQYELDPVLPKVTGTSIDTGPNDPVTLTGQFCGNGTVLPISPLPYAGQPTYCTGSGAVYPVLLQVTGDSQTASQTFSTAVTDLDTQLILDLDGPASVPFFQSGVVVPSSPTPEPSTALWLVPGMLALGWLRKRSLAKASR
jgi:hypothetical protein